MMAKIAERCAETFQFLVQWVCRAALVAALLVNFCIGPAAAGNGSVTYTYDALGRVTSASYDTGVVIIYSYDNNGNRTQQVVNVNTGTMCWDGIVSPCTTTQWSVGLWN